MKDKLIQSASKEALQQNIKTEINSGKEPKQAAAIAYSVQRANDNFGGEIHNISGKIFRGNDGKLYKMPNNSFAIYNKDKQAYYGFKKDNNMPYVPVGGKQALMSILNDGGFLSLDGMVFVTPVRDSSKYLLTIGDTVYKLETNNIVKAIKGIKKVRDSKEVLREYQKFSNGQLTTGQLIKHSLGYTFISSNPKEDTDKQSMQQIEKYILEKGYKPVY